MIVFISSTCYNESVFNKLLILGLLLISLRLNAENCPKADSAKLPLCPPGKMISENYPAKTIALAGFGGVRHQQDGADLPALVKKILIGSGSTPPTLLISTYQKEYDKILQTVDEMVAEPALKQKWKASLVRSGVTGHVRWQQDYFESFIDPKTGQPIVREVSNYSRNGSIGNEFSYIAKGVSPCILPIGEPLQSRAYHSGMDGGNIDALPGGICVLGDNGFNNDVDWNQYADQFCESDKKLRIKAPTDWLNVGHVDEIFKVIPNKKQKAPCDFSVVLSSPRLAFQLLIENSQEKFISPDKKSGTNINADTYRYRTIDPLADICEQAKKIYSPTVTPNTVNGGITNLFYLLLMPDGISAAPTFECKNLTNGQVMNVLNQNEDFKKYNYAVQDKVDHFRKDITEKLTYALPECKPDFIEVPDFYAARSMQNKMGKEVLPKNGSESILSNATNSIAINDLIIGSDSGNSAFRDYTRAEYEKRGLTVDFLDVTDSLHKNGGGNLHCTTQTLRQCRPR